MRVFLSLVLLVLFGLVLAPVQWLSLKLNWKLSRLIPSFFHRYGLPLLGVKVRSFGQVAAARPLLICSNHISWLDIPVISSLLPLIFVSKADVASWPVFGTLARLQRTIFIDRTKRKATKSASQKIAAHLAEGDAIVLFPEGTTGDGNRILPFRSSLLGAAREATSGDGVINIQPTAIVYKGLHGLPMGRVWRPLLAWYGDMTLIPHLLEIVKVGGIEAEVHFGAAVTYPAQTDRKLIAAETGVAVRALMVQALYYPSAHSHSTPARRS